MSDKPGIDGQTFSIILDDKIHLVIGEDIDIPNEPRQLPNGDWVYEIVPISEKAKTLLTTYYGNV